MLWVRWLAVVVAIVVLPSGCSSDQLPEGRSEAIPSDCEMTVVSEGTILGEDVFVGEDQVLAIRIDTFDTSGLSFVDKPTYAFLDTKVEVTSARLERDGDEKWVTTGGFPPYNTTPGTFYQSYKSATGEQVVLEVPTEATYRLYATRVGSGVMGTCQATDI
ncbi:MAG: hypothetical protein V3V01_02925 [Acidimicrobiales bacterium]